LDLDRNLGEARHQGVVARLAAARYADPDQLLDILAQRIGTEDPPLAIGLDGIEDPRNLGSILRTAECAGVHGVFVPEQRATGLTEVVAKVAAGALEYVPVARVTNMVSAIEDLKERGVWIYAADMDGENWCAVDYKGPLAVVIGSEGFGVSRLVKEKSDFIISLPMKGKINSLNASVACGILCYEIARQRGGIQAR
jgi:23S rRNA (guanosine2251-2'-O)-methyltransferase